MEHNDLERTGLFVDAAFTMSAIPNTQQDTNFDGAFNGNLYAQPLFISGSGSTPDLVIVATENNDVIAFNGQTGAQVWSTNLGQNIPLSDLPCGNVDPDGITGTGVIDAASRTFYVDALVANVGHSVFAIDVDTGNKKSGWPVILDGNATANGHSFNYDSSNNHVYTQQQRAALALVNGTVYVPSGGFWGDCGEYYGWVIAIDPSSQSIAGAWSTRARGGGIWGVSGPTVDDQGNLYVSTGNTYTSGMTYGDGEAVVKLATTSFSGVTADFWAPTDWKSLDNSDTDMSGTEPIVFDLGSLHAVLAMGKDGNLYLMDRDNLGGIGGPLASLTNASNNEISNAPAHFSDSQGEMVYYVSAPANCPNGSGDLGAVRIAAGNPPTITPVWCGDEQESLVGGGSPIITSPDGSSGFVVWGVGAGGSNAVRAWDAYTGTMLYDSGPLNPNVRRFQAPIVANGRLYVGADDQLLSFVLQ